MFKSNIGPAWAGPLVIKPEPDFRLKRMIPTWPYGQNVFWFKPKIWAWATRLNGTPSCNTGNHVGFHVTRNLIYP